MRKIVILITGIFLAVGMLVASAQTHSQAEYFIDTDPGVGNGVAIPVSGGTSLDETFRFSTQGLAKGNHRLYIRTRDDNGLWSLGKSMPFFLQDTVTDVAVQEERIIVAAEYFVDEDPGAGSGKPVPVHFLQDIEGKLSISTSGLSNGSHHLYVRTKDNTGVWSMARSFEFAVLPSEGGYPVPEFVTDTVNAGESMTFTNVSDSLGANPSYAWDIYNDSTVEYTTGHITHAFDSTGLYEVKLTVTRDTLSASYLGTVIVGDFDNVSITAGRPLEFCEGDSVVLEAPDGLSYQWNTGDTTQSIVARETGSYFAWLTDANGMTIQSERISVTVTPSFKADIKVQPVSPGKANGFAEVLVSRDDQLTEDSEKIRENESREGYMAAFTYEWSLGDSERSYSKGMSAGSYTVTISHATCTETLPFTITEETPGATGIAAAEYFWDHDPGVGNGTSMNISNGKKVAFRESVSTEGLSTGNHKLYVRTRSNNGIWSLAKSMDVFIQDTVKPEPASEERFIAAAEYFIDSITAVGSGTPIPVDAPVKTLSKQLSINTGHLSQGDHSLYIRVKDDQGRWSNYETLHFQNCGLLPAAPVIGDAEVCYGASVSLTAGGTQGNTYRWFTSDTTLIEGATGETYNTGALMQETSYLVAQVDAGGCQSQMMPVTVQVNNAAVYAGIDETLSKAGEAYLLSAYFPETGAWSGSQTAENGWVSRNQLSAGEYELTYSIDSLGCTFTDTKKLTIVDLSSQVSLTMEENPLTGTLLAENDFSNIQSHAIIKGDTAAIHSDLQGNIRVLDSSRFDFETNQTMAWTINYTEDIKTVHQVNLTVNLVNASDPPSVSDLLFTINENSPNGTLVGTIQASDPDSPTLQYAIESGNAGGVFALQNVNELVVNDSTLLDYEQDTAFVLQVSVTDGFFTRVAEVTVRLNDLDDNGNAPPVITNQAFSVDENSPAGMSIGVIQASDSENDTLVFEIVEGNTNEAFGLDAIDGELTVNDSTQLDYETRVSFGLTVVVTGGGLTDTAVITINLNDVDETVNQPPLPFELVYPEHNLNNVTLTPEFSWKASHDEDPLDYPLYRLHVASDSLFEHEVYQSGLVTDTSHQITALLDSNTIYYWYVEAVDTDDMVTTSTINQFNTMGKTTNINENPMWAFEARIYPNPTSGLASIDLSGITGKVDIMVYHINGTLLKQMQLQVNGNMTTKLDLEGYARGLYVVRFKAKDYVINKSLIIE